MRVRGSFGGLLDQADIGYFRTVRRNGQRTRKRTRLIRRCPLPDSSRGRPCRSWAVGVRKTRVLAHSLPEDPCQNRHGSCSYTGIGFMGFIPARLYLTLFCLFVEDLDLAANQVMLWGYTINMCIRGFRWIPRLSLAKSSLGPLSRDWPA